jgi:hypothetical protein
MIFRSRLIDKPQSTIYKAEIGICISFLSCSVVNIYQLKRVIWSASVATVKPKFSFVMWITRKHMWVLSVWKNENSIKLNVRCYEERICLPSLSESSQWCCITRDTFQKFRHGLSIYSSTMFIQQFCVRGTILHPRSNIIKILIPQQIFYSHKCDSSVQRDKCFVQLKLNQFDPFINYYRDVRGLCNKHLQHSHSSFWRVTFIGL